MGRIGADRQDTSKWGSSWQSYSSCISCFRSSFTHSPTLPLAPSPREYRGGEGQSENEARGGSEVVDVAIGVLAVLNGVLVVLVGRGAWRLRGEVRDLQQQLIRHRVRG